MVTSVSSCEYDQAQSRVSAPIITDQVLGQWSRIRLELQWYEGGQNLNRDIYVMPFRITCTTTFT